jgi:hypothetical protein
MYIYIYIYIYVYIGQRLQIQQLNDELQEANQQLIDSRSGGNGVGEGMSEMNPGMYMSSYACIYLGVCIDICMHEYLFENGVDARVTVGEKYCS